MDTQSINNLPPDIVARVEAQVASGHFPDVAAVLRAGMEALDSFQEYDREWLGYARLAFQKGTEAIDKSESISGSPADIMAVIQSDVDKLTGNKGG